MADDLVGRGAEVAAIAAALARHPGGLNVVIVEGVAGIGKTALLRHVFEAHTDGLALAARPVESEQQLTFATLGDLLSDLDPAEFAGLPPPQQTALDAALLRSGDGQAPNVRVVGTALHGVLARIAERAPLLVVIDDVQWADRTSAAALVYALRRLGSHDVRVVLAERVAHHSAADAWGLDDALGERPPHVRVGPLSLGAIFYVVRERLGVSLPRPLLARITDESGGNPLYAIELAQAIGDHAVSPVPGEPLPVSTTLEGLIESRLARVPDAWSDTLLSLALLRDPPLGELERAVPGAAAVIEAAHRAGLVEWRAERLRFSHPLYAAGVVGRASPPARRAAHRQLAAISSDAERRARHLALAATGPDEEIAEALTDAALAASRRGAWAQAAELAELAQRASASAAAGRERWLRRAEFMARAGDAPGAAHALANLLDDGIDGELRARVLETRARVLFDTAAGEHAAATLCDEALALAVDPALRARIHVTRGAARGYVDLADAIADAEQALAILETLADPDPAVYTTAVMVLAGSRFDSGEPLPMDVIERGMAMERQHPNPDVGDRLGPALGSFLKYAGRLTEARQHLLDGYHAAVDEGDDGSLPYAVSHLPQLELWLGRTADAERWAREHLALAEHNGQDGQRISALYNLAQVHTHQGRFAEAEADLAAAEALVADVDADAAWMSGPLAAARGSLRLARGDPDRAIGELRRATGVFAGTGAGRPRRGDHDLAEALVRVGELDEAVEVIDRLEAASRRTGHHDLLGAALTCRATVAAAQQRPDDALALIDAALAELELGEEPLARGRALLTLGQIRRRRGERRLAIDAFEAAERLFDGIDAAVWAAQAAAERARVPVRQRAGPGLTDGEQRVAGAAARGLTNAEIAAELFVSVKTVEANLTRAYTKLGVRSRAELAARVAASSDVAATEQPRAR